MTLSRRAGVEDVRERDEVGKAACSARRHLAETSDTDNEERGTMEDMLVERLHDNMFEMGHVGLENCLRLPTCL